MHFADRKPEILFLQNETILLASKWASILWTKNSQCSTSTFLKNSSGSFCPTNNKHNGKVTILIYLLQPENGENFHLIYVWFWRMWVCTAAFMHRIPPISSRISSSRDVCLQFFTRRLYACVCVCLFVFASQIVRRQMDIGSMSTVIWEWVKNVWQNICTRRDFHIGIACARERFVFALVGLLSTIHMMSFSSWHVDKRTKPEGNPNDFKWQSERILFYISLFIFFGFSSLSFAHLHVYISSFRQRDEMRFGRFCRSNANDFSLSFFLFAFCRHRATTWHFPFLITENTWNFMKNVRTRAHSLSLEAWTTWKKKIREKKNETCRNCSLHVRKFILFMNFMIFYQ